MPDVWEGTKGVLVAAKGPAEKTFQRAAIDSREIQVWRSLLRHPWRAAGRTRLRRAGARSRRCRRRCRTAG